MVKGENVRLLLFAKDGTNQKPQSRLICWGNCYWFTLTLFICIFVFLIFLVFIAIRVGEIHRDMKRKRNPEDTIPGSDFCKSVNAENMSMVALGYLNGIREESNAMEGKNNIYYLTNRWFTDQEACAIEALLRLLQDKAVYIIEIGNFTSTNHTSVDFIGYLRHEYTNLNHIRSTPKMFFQGSPFQNNFKTVDEFSMFAAKVMLVWQFGGTVLSPKILLLNRRMYENNEGYCEVDSQLLFCPNQCSAYCYQLVKTILDLIKSSQGLKLVTEESFQDIIDRSVIDYCGDVNTVTVGCIGINRIKYYKICSKLNSQCDFLRVQEWKNNDNNWKNTVQKFCPKIVSKFLL